VKIMLLAILPNWNSLDSVRHAHSDLELAGLVFFALLVVAEALAHNSEQEKRKHLFDSIGIWFFAIAVLCEIAGYWYGQRNDTLSEQVIVSLDAKARDAASNASTALSNSKDAETKSSGALDKAGKAQEKAEDALAKAKAAENKLAWRDLTPHEQADIALAVRKFGPKKYSIVIFGNLPEITRFADKVLNTLTQADWTPDGWGFAMGGSASGVLVSTEKGAPTDVTAAANALVIAFNAKGIFAIKAPQYDHGSLPAAMTGPWKGEAPIRVSVGAKP
jgi:hypothetical protein